MRESSNRIALIFEGMTDSIINLHRQIHNFYSIDRRLTQYKLQVLSRVNNLSDLSRESMMADKMRDS